MVQGGGNGSTHPVLRPSARDFLPATDSAFAFSSDGLNAGSIVGALVPVLVYLVLFWQANQMAFWTFLYLLSGFPVNPSNSVRR